MLLCLAGYRPVITLIYQNQSNSLSFLLKRHFLWLQMLSVPLNKGVKPSTKSTFAYRLALIHSAVQAYNLSSKLPAHIGGRTGWAHVGLGSSTFKCLWHHSCQFTPPQKISIVFFIYMHLSPHFEKCSTTHACTNTPTALSSFEKAIFCFWCHTEKHQFYWNWVTTFSALSEFFTSTAKILCW